MPMVVMEPFPGPTAAGSTTPESRIAQDSCLVSQPYRCDTLTIVVGQRFETITIRRPA
jgi:hypothetical protein